ncbi:nucleoside deaminase [Streptomyces sp. NBC_00249]|uniref:nucleoside deaminase n=1 Tax=Streptomyces sp. NBC_00249 TaxID=2975690 RepID=UPI0022584D94|nr:nucleoside deaminase [Streptomyces sp. NBC_00249]MCX5198275.1 nucleoside deaminase [Streptomyces sp. NBC_00249]
MTRGGGGDFEVVWAAAPEAVRRALTLSYEALAAGGLAVGAVLTDPAGAVLAEGRNEAYEEGPGTGPLRGTPLAHAEMNALGAARTGWDLGSATLWSTQEPCGMCAAAAGFTGVGRVRYLAPDPWALAEGADGSSGAEPVGEDLWLLAANVMFLRSVAVAAAGPGEPEILRHHRTAEPETAALHDAVPAGLPGAGPAEAWLAGLWPRLDRAASARAARLQASRSASAAAYPAGADRSRRDQPGTGAGASAEPT